jgi:hypothetical protein
MDGYKAHSWALAALQLHDPVDNQKGSLDERSALRNTSSNTRTTQVQNKCLQTSMTRWRFEHLISVFG